MTPPRWLIALLFRLRGVGLIRRLTVVKVERVDATNPED
jgi:hypothetical protein